MLTLEPSIISIILLSVLALFVVIQLIYHFSVFGRLIKKQPYELVEKKWEGVSIVIAARSEYDNLQKLIPALLAQDYPNFEIIVVDDASWDGTTGYLEELEKMSIEGKAIIKAVYITDEMKKNYQGKKLALSLGIKAATNEILLFTDADCLPSSNSWIKHMVLPYHGNPETEIVLGYSPFNGGTSMINLFSRMDNLYTALSYFSYALGKDPYMGVGRNLSYKKSLFFKLKGFASHLHIAPGDDDLFIQDAANSNNTAICIHPDAYMFTDAKSSFGKWFAQKKRHNFVGKYYKSAHRFKLGMFAFTHALLWLSFIANCFIYDSLGWALIIMGLYWTIKWPLIYLGFKKLQQAGKSAWMPLFDLLFVAYNFVFGIVTVFGKQKKW